MPRASLVLVTCWIVVCLAIGGVSSAGDKPADDAAARAARTAQAQHGGRVLAVERQNGGYRVKLLKDSGTVKVVMVPVPEPGKPGDTRVGAPKRKAGDSSIRLHQAWR